MLPNSKAVPTEESEVSRRSNSIKEDTAKSSKFPSELSTTGSGIYSITNTACKIVEQFCEARPPEHQSVRTIDSCEEVLKRREEISDLASGSTILGHTAETKDLGSFNNVLVEDSYSSASVTRQHRSQSITERSVGSKSAANSPKIEGQSGQSNVNDNDYDNTVNESNDYSNPRSTESLDMECHESGDDTVIVVKEKPRGKKRKLVDTSGESVIAPKLHRARTEGAVHFVPVGEPLKKFLEGHSLVQGMYLNRGKRDIKRSIVSVTRQKTAVDTGSWKRGPNIHERNRLDDVFELTQEGKKRAELIKNKWRRDEYVVNWYLWCPGHNNCQRKCGIIGKCAEGKQTVVHLLYCLYSSENICA